MASNVLALSPDGRSAAILTNNQGLGKSLQDLRRLQLYDLKTNKSIELPGLQVQGWISQMAFAPGSRRFAAGSNDGVVRLWDRDTGKLLRELKQERWTRPPMNLIFAADGRSLAWWDGSVRIWEVASGGRAPASEHEPYREFPGLLAGRSIPGLRTE